MPDMFEAAKTVSAQEAAERYMGVQPKQRGKYRMCRCPWHHDKTPSLAFFDDGMFKCFGCQAKGTSIEVAKLAFNLDRPAAALRICMDFGVTFDNEGTPSKKQIASRSRKASREELTAFDTEACAYLRAIERIVDLMEARERNAEDYSEDFKRALRERSAIKAVTNQLLDIFDRDDIDAGVALMNAYKSQRDKWKKIVSYVASMWVSE